METLGFRIKTLREAKTITQAELARRVSTSRTAINNYENGLSCPSPAVLLAISRELDASVDYILSNDRYAGLSVSGLSEQDVKVVKQLIEHLKGKSQ